MTELEVILPRKGAIPSEAAIEAVISRAGLRVTMRGTLAQFADCTHWHLKKGNERGVLELTVWPQGKRVWLSMQDGRQGAWVMRVARELKRMLESKVTQ